MSRILRLFLCSLLWLAPLGAQAPTEPATASQTSQTTATPSVLAAEPAAKVAKPAPSPVMDAKHFFEMGGPILKVLAALSIAMVAMIVFFILTIRRGAVVSDYFMRTADALIRKQDYLGLLSVCSQRNEAIASITQKALDFATRNPTATFEEVREVTQSEGQRQASMLTQRVTYLADVAAVAPMIGLLGTVWGIMKEFASISNKASSDAMSMQSQFAGGTAEALINTAAGLCIAIPAMIVYSLYRGRVNTLLSELEAAATHIMALLGSQYKRVTNSTRAAAAQR